MTYEPDDLDILSRAFHSAMESALMNERDEEATKAALMSGILRAARTGERDEERLKQSALDAMKFYDQDGMDAVMRTTPL